MADNSTPQLQNSYVTMVVLAVGTIVVIFTILLISYLFLRSRHRVNSTRGTAPQDGVVIGIDEAALDSCCPKIIYSEKTRQSLKSGDSDEEVEEMESCCSICLSDYKESEVVRVIPDCGHMFHAVCIDQWFRRHDTCPVCRISLQSLLGPVPQRTPTPWPTPSITVQLELILSCVLKYEVLQSYIPQTSTGYFHIL